MIRIATLLLAMALSPTSFGKGRAWSYTMSGTAYDKATKDVLRNTSLMIGKQLVTTDSVGRYSVEISGITCDRGTPWQIERCNEEAFGHVVIRRVLSEASITIRTHWKRYAFRCGLILVPPYGEYRNDLYMP